MSKCFYYKKKNQSKKYNKNIPNTENKYQSYWMWGDEGRQSC